MNDQATTPRTTMRVLIMGGGPAGLLMAHGLRKEGHDVEVFERRDAGEGDLFGFGLHLHTHGTRALQELLSAESWELFNETAGPGGGGDVRFTDEHMNLLVDYNDGAKRRAVGRTQLRIVLTDGLGDVLHYHKAFERYELLPEGGVRAHFADGTHADGDFLIGADGPSSPVRRQFLPALERLDVPATVIVGRALLTDELAAELPPELVDGVPASVVPDAGRWFFTCLWRLGTLHGEPVTPYIIWALTAHPSAYSDEIWQMDGQQLRTLVLERIADFAAPLRRVVEAGEDETTSVLALKTMPKLEPWEPSDRVVLVGDAIHNMTPLAGIGANTALRDCVELRDQLREHSAGRKTLKAAVGDYEAKMREYANVAIEQSRRNAVSAASPARFPRFMFRNVLKLAHRSPTIKRRLFQLAKSTRQFQESATATDTRETTNA